MENYGIEGVIFEPTAPTEISYSRKDISKRSALKHVHVRVPVFSIRTLLWLLLVVLAVGLFIGYQQYQRAVELESKLVNAEEQLQQAQVAYGQTFQEKVTLQSALTRMGNTTVATPSAHVFSIKQIVGKPQKIAQTFRPNSAGPVTLVGIQVYGSYAVGDKLLLTLYKHDAQSLESGDTLGVATANVSEIVKARPINFLFTSGIVLDPKQDYMFTIEAVGSVTEVDIELSKTDIDNTGMMYEFTPRIGKDNEILDTNHSWKPREQRDILYDALIAKS